MSKICDIDDDVFGHEILKNGDLKLFLNDNGKACQKELQKWVSNRVGKRYSESYQDFENKLYEELYWDEFRVLDSSQTGDLTDAPMIGQDVLFDDDGYLEEDTGNIWFYQNYMTVDPFEKLVESGEVVFTQRTKFT